MLKNKDFLLSNSQMFLFIVLIIVKMPTIVGILTFMSMINFMLVELSMKKSFITSGPGVVVCIYTVFNSVQTLYDGIQSLTSQIIKVGKADQIFPSLEEQSY